MEKSFIYDGVVSGKKVDSWVCPIVEVVVDGKKKTRTRYCCASRVVEKDVYSRKRGVLV